jgi:hypothetical protein
MRFLARRIIRVKVNGHGIRASANPDDEPKFYEMDPVPRDPDDDASSDDDGDDDEEEDNNDGNEYSRDAADSPMSDENAGDDSSTTSTVTSSDEDMGASASTSTSRSPRKVASGQPAVPFPLKLHSFLDTLEASGAGKGIIGWLSHGRAFAIHDPVAFSEALMPSYLGQTKYSSFQRQLHLYSFQRISTGRDKGAYYHENFLRGKPELLSYMVRTSVNGRGFRQRANPDSEPNLYALEPIPSLAPSKDAKR